MPEEVRKDFIKEIVFWRLEKKFASWIRVVNFAVRKTFGNDRDTWETMAWLGNDRFVWLYYGNNSGDCEEMKLYITLRL